MSLQPRVLWTRKERIPIRSFRFGGADIMKMVDVRKYELKMVDVPRYEKRLRDRLRELNEILKEIGGNLDHAGLAESKMIQAGLAQIKDGTFGFCIVCGETISKERLEVLPHTSRCKHCA